MPGTSATLTPFCETHGLFFDPKNEPESFKFNFDNAIMNHFIDDTKICVGPKMESVEQYYDFIERCNNINDKFSITITPINKPVNAEDDI